jgi:CBS domain containing-hemolysin-like protein
MRERAGRLVEEGEGVTCEGVSLVVETAENNRILEVRVDLSGTGAT